MNWENESVISIDQHHVIRHMYIEYVSIHKYSCISMSLTLNMWLICYAMSVPSLHEVICLLNKVLGLVDCTSGMHNIL